MPQLQSNILGQPAVFKRTDFTPYKCTWGQTKDGHRVHFRVIHWNRDGTSESLPHRDPKTHPKEASPMTTDQVYCAQRDRDTRSVDADSVPLKSRYEQRLASKKKSQEAYGRRRWSQHAEWVNSQLECHRMNEEALSPSSSATPSEHCWVRPRSRRVDNEEEDDGQEEQETALPTSATVDGLSLRYPLTILVGPKSDHWYKTKKMGTNPAWWRPKAIRAHRRKDRAGRKQKASQHDNDYRVKRGREISATRQRQGRKHR